MQKGPLELTYRIYEYTAKRIKLDTDVNKQADGGEEMVQDETQTNGGNSSSSSSDWKEVQLRISENGEMSVMGIQEDEIETKNEQPPALKLIGKSTTSNTSTATTATSNSNTGTTCVNVLTNVNTSVESDSAATTAPSTTTTTTSISVVDEQKTVVSTTTTTSESSDNKVVVVTTAETKNNNVVSEMKNQGVKHKIETITTTTTAESEPPQKQIKTTVANNSVQHLSNNHPLKKHSQMARNVESESTKTFTKPVVTYVNKNLQQQQQQPVSRPGTPVTVSKCQPKQQPPPCYMPKTTYTPIINVPKVQTSTAKPSTSAITTPTTAINTKMTIKSKPSTPIGYKTLRDPPKSWNPQISRANLTKPTNDPKYTDLKNVRPAKFFKMRNNMPRYLGNPASGVKPMYQVHTSPEKDKSEIKKHSIVKIDPKTLKPIAEKAPETTSLSNQSDLKINTSSVSIFNPLKLQSSSSPKNERRSPKSPHSPKPTNTTTTKTTNSSPPNKREKLNLNFTPPNPFIPNLTSPTCSPNQFLYPSGPPGFPSYDPRFMAAYHSLLYGQRMPFTPNHLQNLTLDLNQRGGMVAPSTSPKLSKPLQNQPPLAPPPPTSPKVSSSNSPKPTQNQSVAPSTSPKIQSQSNSPKQSSMLTKGATTGVKRSMKEGGQNKGEKSLQNAVEKLTQKKVESMANSVNKCETVVKETTKNNNLAVVKKDEATVVDGGGGGEEKKPEVQEKQQQQQEKKSDINEIKDKSDKTVDTGTKLEEEKKKNLSNNNTDSLESLVPVDGKK